MTYTYSTDGDYTTTLYGSDDSKITFGTTYGNPKIVDAKITKSIVMNAIVGKTQFLGTLYIIRIILYLKEK